MIKQLSFKKIRLFYRERNIFLAVNVSLGGIILSLAFILFRFSGGDQLIPLHYDIFFGIDRFGPWYRLFMPVLITACSTLINFLIAYYLFAWNKYASYALTIVMSITSVMMTLYLITLSSYL